VPQPAFTRAHYELFTRPCTPATVAQPPWCSFTPPCGPTQDDDIAGLCALPPTNGWRRSGQPAHPCAYLPYAMAPGRPPAKRCSNMIIPQDYGPATPSSSARDMAGCNHRLSG